MSKRKERPESINLSRELDDYEIYNCNEKRRNVGEFNKSIANINEDQEKENLRSGSSSILNRNEKNDQDYYQLLFKYENLQNSHNTLQKVVKSLLDKISQLNELYSQKDKELNECKIQLKKLIDANETLNLYIQSSHSSIMNNNIINKFGSDIY